MRRFLFIAAILFATPATSAEATIEDACLRAAEHYFGVEGLTSLKVQNFAELNPPRVRMNVAGVYEPDFEPDKVAALLDIYAGNPSKPQEPMIMEYENIMCEFQNTTAPLYLSAFECSDLCFVTNRRLEELRTLLNRDGF